MEFEGIGYSHSLIVVATEVLPNSSNAILQYILEKSTQSANVKCCKIYADMHV